jgi:hypothetical protein
MDTIKKNYFVNTRNLAILLVGMLLVYFAVTTIVNNKLTEVEVNTMEKINNQLVLLTAIAEVTSRNGADSITESIVKDCTVGERSSFDNLLGRLDDNLSRSQLVELERLFGRCGSFFSDRKSVMVARLSREIEVFQDHVGLLQIVHDKDLNANYSVSLWQDLASAEQNQSKLFSRLVSLQDKIISTLLAGKSANSPEIIEILQEVKEVQETLLVANSQTEKVRSGLISL